MFEYTYVNEFGELWRLQVDECGTIRLGGDETDGEMMTIGPATTSGSVILSWSEMAWLSTVMAQLEARRMMKKLDTERLNP